MGCEPTQEKPSGLTSINITTPTNKEHLIRFLCMMQSNAGFIPNFAKKSALLRGLTKGRAKFKWTKEHQNCFEELIEAFKKDVLLHYFNMEKPTFVLLTLLKLDLVPCWHKEKVKVQQSLWHLHLEQPVKQSICIQLDLEAMSVDFGLRRFLHYLLGSPDETTVVTDHKPLCGIFNGNRHGSIRTERIKMRHQDIRFHVEYQK